MNIQKILIRREIQEHKGGFVWAPLAAAAAFLVIALGGMVIGSIAAQNAVSDGGMVVAGQSMGSAHLGQVLSSMSPSDLDQVGKVMDFSLLVSMAWPLVIVGLVAFFYCLSCLYDERRDRSVLFWKSMPVSDEATVASKAISALIVVPLIAALVGVASMLVFYLAMLIMAAVHGINPGILLHHAHPFSVMMGVFAMLPIYALWALPTAGWLILCSSLARSKPMLWAILLPIMLGLGAAILGLGESGWVWHHVAMRALLGFFPGAWLAEAPQSAIPLSLSSSYGLLASPSMWIGAMVGVGMLVVAARARRWKDEG